MRSLLFGAVIKSGDCYGFGGRGGRTELPPSSEALIYSPGGAKSIINCEPKALYDKELVAISGGGAGLGKKMGERRVEFRRLRSLIFGLRRRIIGP